MTQVIVPWRSLSRSALSGVIEDFVTREGTEYGTREVSLATKVAQVERQLERREVVIVFDSVTDTTSIRPLEPGEELPELE